MRTTRTGRPKSLSASTPGQVLVERDLRLFLRKMSVREKRWAFEWLISKACWDEKEFTREDAIAAVLVYADLLDHCERDDNLMKVLWFPLVGAKGFVSRLSRSVKEAKLAIDRIYSEGLIHDANTYYGIKHEKESSGLKNVLRVFRMGRYSKLSQAYVGVGYKDKGNCREVEQDGSPSWQEVATDEWYQNHSGTTRLKKLKYSWENPPVLLPEDVKLVNWEAEEVVEWLPKGLKRKRQKKKFFPAPVFHLVVD